MNVYDIKKSANETAATFRQEFPGQEPELSWLAEAAAIEHVPDESREAWEAAVRNALVEYRSRKLHAGFGYYSTKDGDCFSSYRRLKSGELSLKRREWQSASDHAPQATYVMRYYRASAADTEGFDPQSANTDPVGLVWVPDPTAHTQGPVWNE